jgi:hypothetical protein
MWTMLGVRVPTLLQPCSLFPSLYHHIDKPYGITISLPSYSNILVVLTYLQSTYVFDYLQHLSTIGNNLKTSKKWKLQGSWNGTIVLTNKKITKVVCFKCYNHKTMACKVLCALKKHERKEWKTTQNHSTIYYLLTLK